MDNNLHLLGNLIESVHEANRPDLFMSSENRTITSSTVMIFSKFRSGWPEKGSENNDKGQTVGFAEKGVYTEYYSKNKKVLSLAPLPLVVKDLKCKRKISVTRLGAKALAIKYYCAYKCIVTCPSRF